MAHYAYKRVAFRIPAHIIAAFTEYAEREPDGDPGYDGDYWILASDWIDELIAQKAEADERVGRATVDELKATAERDLAVWLLLWSGLADIAADIAARNLLSAMVAKGDPGRPPTTRPFVSAGVRAPEGMHPLSPEEIDRFRERFIDGVQHRSSVPVRGR